MTLPIADVDEIVGRYVSIGGIRTYYESLGEGPPIVCLPSAAADGRQYRYLLGRLSHSFRVIAVDLPGCGKTYPSFHPFRLIDDESELAGFVWQFMDRLELKDPVLLGCAMTGNLVLSMAAEGSDRLTAVVSAQGAANTTGVVTPQTLDILDHPKVNVADFMEAFTLGICGRRLDPAILKECVWQNARSLKPDLMKACVTIYANHDVTDRLASIRCPVLLVRGTSDWSVDHGMVEATKRGIGDCELVELEGVGHFPMLEDPARFAAVVEEFLRRVAGAA